jgi:hypothetical protein
MLKAQQVLTCCSTAKVGRLLGSLTKHCAMKSLKSLDLYTHQASEVNTEDEDKVSKIRRSFQEADSYSYHFDPSSLGGGTFAITPTNVTTGT